MKFSAFAAAATLLAISLATPAQAQTPQTCYDNYPGPKGKACCDKSYRSHTAGAKMGTARMAELMECTGQGRPPMKRRDNR
jgi:hypothetical protein